MNEIYVVKTVFHGYEPASVELIDELIDEGHTLVGTTIEVGSTIVHLYEERLFVFGKIDDEEAEARKIVNTYFDYVCSITGLPHPKNIEF